VFLTLLVAGYLTLQNSWVQTKITQRVARVLSEKLNTKISVGHVKIRSFNQLHFEDILIEDQSSDTLLFAQHLTASIDTLKFKKQIFSIDELKFSGNKLNINRDTADAFNFNFLFLALGKNPQRSTNDWIISCNKFRFQNVDIDYFDYSEHYKKSVFVDDLNLDVSDFKSQADSVSFHIDQLKMNDGDILQLETMNAAVGIKAREITITHCNIKSKYSEVNNASLRLKLPVETDSISKPMDMHLTIDNSHMSFIELGELLPGFRGMDQRIDFSGEIFGNINDLKGRDIILSTGQDSHAALDFYINEPRDPENMYVFIDLKILQTSFNDLAKVRLPNRSDISFLTFPEGFYKAGLLRFEGNFSGFLTDFVTFGTLESQMGTLKTDMLVTPDKSRTTYYRGNLSTENFDLGKLFNNSFLGNLTFSGSVDGNYNMGNQKISGVFKGDVASIDINQYTYSDLKFDGVLFDKMFDGLLTIDDPNLKFSFMGQIDFNSSMPDFDFGIQVDRALPGNLNFGDKFPNAELAFKMIAQFSGNRIDNMNGFIEVDNGFYRNRNGEIDLGGMKLQTNQQNHQDSLSFYSRFLDLDITGNYQFKTLLATLSNTINRFIPSYQPKTHTTNTENQFTYKLSIKDINPLATALLPDLQIDKPFLLYGKVNSATRDFELEGSIPGLRYGNIMGRDIFIGNKGVDDSYYSKFRFGEIHLADGMNLYNFKIDSKITNDVLDNSISWSNYDNITYSGDIRTQTVFSKADSSNSTNITISGKESEIVIADTVWNITPFHVKIDSSNLYVSGFNMSNNNQVLAVNGSIRKDKTDLLRLQMMNLDLSRLGNYLGKKLNISGIVNGTVGLANLTSKPVLLSDVRVNKFTFKNHLIGDISLLSKWNNEKALIDSELKVSHQQHTNLVAFGTFHPASKALNFDVDLDSIPLVLLETFIANNLSNFKGYASGSINLGGTADKLLANGAIMAHNAGLTIDVTQIPYSFNDSVYFSNDSILFRNVAIFDDQNNTGLFNGSIVHRNFSNMTFNLAMTSNKIRAMNTTYRDNEKFYGVAVVSGQINITNPNNTMFLNGSVTSLQGTEVNISMESENEAERYDFIRFIGHRQTEEPDFYDVKTTPPGKPNLRLAIEVTPAAKIQLIYDAQIGDVIKAQGKGVLLFQMNEEGELFLSGNYQPTKGDYLFTLQNVLNKRLTIEPGGSITWSGNPYNADIDLSAVYSLKASLYDLLVDSYSNISETQRIQVECIIHLKDELANPTISFDINFPNLEERVKDQLQQYFNTDDELNKQILSLIVLGKFYTPDYMRGTYEAQNTNMFGTTASELFSNQLSNWLSQINENWDIGVNYRPGNSVTDDEIELALSTQIFNDRVTLNGNIGNNADQYSTNSSQIVGDFEINVKLVPSGKLQFKAYHQSNTNVIYETAPYTQGIGVSITEEYNTFGELLRKIRNLFSRKKQIINEKQ